ncbi:MAG: peptidoglycan-binding protein [Pseudolabrys sp.]
MPRVPSRARNGPDRRMFLNLLGAGLAAGGAWVGRAGAAEDKTLQALIDQNQRREHGQDFDSASRTIHMPKASLPTLSPSTVETTAQAIAQYEAILSSGGWPKVPPTDRLRLGNRHPSVMPLRKRLIITGDLEASAGTTDIFDSYVEAAVRRFQARHGITVDGIVRAESFDRLNIPCDVRLSQLKTNLVRLRSLTSHLPNRYVVCNIPAAQIEAVEDGVAVSRHTAVVGKPDRPSPEINSKIVEINFNPYWTVPVSIVRRDLIPLMQKDPAYLTNEHIRIFDMHRNELTPSQVNWYSDEARITFSSRIPAISIRLVRSASISLARTASTCTTRRSRTCSARTCASIPPAACACRTCASWWIGCCAIRRAGRGRRSMR